MDVVLDQDGHPVADAGVVGDVARLGLEGHPALGRIARVAIAAVAQAQDAVLILHDLVDGRHHLGALVLQQGGVAVGVERPGVGHRLLVPGAVGGVAVDDQDGIPGVEDTEQEALDLGAFGLEGVAVEVEALAVVTDALTHLRAHLAGAALGIDLVVPVGVEDGRHQQDQLVQVGRLGRGQDVAHQHQRGFLALDFAGVDVGLNVDDRLAQLARLEGRGGQGIADDDQGHVLALGRDAQRLDPKERAHLLQLADEGHHVGVQGRLLVVGGFGHGQELGGLGGGSGRLGECPGRGGGQEESGGGDADRLGHGGPPRVREGV